LAWIRTQETASARLDTPDQLRYNGLALVVEGLVPVIEDLMN